MKNKTITIQCHGVSVTISDRLELDDALMKEIDLAVMDRLTKPMIARRILSGDIEYDFAPDPSVGCQFYYYDGKRWVADDNDLTKIPADRRSYVEINGVKGEVVRVGRGGQPAPEESELDLHKIQWLRTKSCYVSPANERYPDLDPSIISYDFD